VWWQLDSQYDPLERLDRISICPQKLTRYSCPEPSALILGRDPVLYGLRGQQVHFVFRPVLHVFGRYVFLKPFLKADLGVPQGSQRLLIRTLPQWILFFLLVLKSPPLIAKFIWLRLRAGSESASSIIHSELISNFYSKRNYRKWIQDCQEALQRGEPVSGGSGEGPMFSIVVPVYKTAIGHLEKTLRSVLNQSYPNWELIVVDDHSESSRLTDFLREFERHDSRVRVFETSTNLHISLATDFGVRQSRGDWIGFLDHDDLLDPMALRVFVDEIRKNEKVNLVFCDEDKIQGHERFFPHFKPGWRKELLETCNYVSHFTVLRRSIYNEIGGLRAKLEGAQDWDLLLRYLKKFGSAGVVHIPWILYSWRVHPESTSSDLASKPYIKTASVLALQDYFGGRFEPFFDGIQFLQPQEFSKSIEKSFISWAIKDIFLAYHKRFLSFEVQHDWPLYPSLLRPLVRVNSITEGK
jgi:glycosyltransferase involved in cell wall biosynthesis